MVRLGTKPPLLHVVEALYREYCFSATKSLPRCDQLALGWLGDVLQCVWGVSDLQQLENGRGEALI